MKLQGSLKDLVKVEGDKRDLLPPPQTPAVATLSQKPRSNPLGRPAVKEEGITYVATRLQLPEDVKMDLDRLFLDYKKELKGGKNHFMVQAIRGEIERFRAERSAATK